MRKTIISALLAGCALIIPALAQTPPRNFIHERIQLRTFLHHENIRGWLVMIDLNDGQGKNINSQLQGFLVSNGAMIFDCSGPTQGLVGPNDAPGIVQVGPFAQQARGDTNLIDFALQGSCPLPPRTVLEIDCPFQGLTVTKAPGHEQFTYSATYVDAITGLPGSYTQRGQHGPIDCVVSVNGAQYGFEGFLTRIVETRRGFDAFQQPIPPTWEIPDRLFNIEDLAK